MRSWGRRLVVAIGVLSLISLNVTVARADTVITNLTQLQATRFTWGPGELSRIDFLTGPGTPPKGSGSVYMYGGFHNATDDLGPVGELTKFSVHQYGSIGTSVLWLELDRNDGSFYGDQLVATIPASSGWKVTDLTTASSLSDNGSSTTTFGAYVSSHPSATITEWGVGCSWDCYMDDLQVTFNGSTSTYDFEPGATTNTGSLSIAASAGTITAGQGVTVSGTLGEGATQYARQAYAYRPVALYGKTYPATSYSKVLDATTDAYGNVSKVLKPLKQTTYQWRYAGDPSVTAVNSATKTVTVKTTLTMHVHDATISHTTPLIVWGLTTPDKSGTTIYLKWHTSSGDATLATTTVKSDGTYLFYYVPGYAHSFYVKVVIAAATGNLSNSTSAVKIVAS